MSLRIDSQVGKYWKVFTHYLFLFSGLRRREKGGDFHEKTKNTVYKTNVVLKSRPHPNGMCLNNNFRQKGTFVKVILIEIDAFFLPVKPKYADRLFLHKLFCLFICLTG